MDHAFCAWFYYLPSMNENDCFQRSLEVEPGPNNATPDLRRNRNNLSATSNGSNGKMNSITRMFGYLADEFTTNLKGNSLLNGHQISNDSGIHNSEESFNSSAQPPTQIESSAVAMALISRGKMLATPGIPGMPISTPNPVGAWRLNSSSGKLETKFTNF